MSRFTWSDRGGIFGEKTDRYGSIFAQKGTGFEDTLRDRVGVSCCSAVQNAYADNAGELSRIFEDMGPPFAHPVMPCLALADGRRART
jgi:hypothetical protein